MYKWLYNIVPVGMLELINEKFSDADKMQIFLKNVDPELLEDLSRRKVMKVFRQARRQIPAYKRFLHEHRVRGIRNINDFNEKLPVLDKKNYVKKYPLIERTQKRAVPRGLLVESSGSSADHPTNWFRTYQEEEEIKRDVEFESRYLFGNKPFIVISTWSLGAWTTSLSFCYYFEPLGTVKNIGPDVEQIVKTMRLMGTKRNYLIGGYPPFVKHLLDTGGLKWKNYKVDFVVGGEGFTPGWLRYVKGKLHAGAKVVSAYGASDLETGMAVETPLSQRIRELFDEHHEKMQEVFGVDELPSFFQYNPLRFYINNIKKTKEFHTTVLTKGHVGCKIKYNIKDKGGKLSYNEMIEIMKKNFKRFSTEYNRKFNKNSIKLPFLWIAGRTDDVISLDGVNIFPQQVEESLQMDGPVYRKIQSFRIAKLFDKDGGHIFQVNVQLQQRVKPYPRLAREIKDTIKKNFSKINLAYKLGLHDFPACYEPHVKLYAYKTGPFDTSRIKQKYIEN